MTALGRLKSALYIGIYMSPLRNEYYAVIPYTLTSSQYSIQLISVFELNLVLPNYSIILYTSALHNMVSIVDEGSINCPHKISVHSVTMSGSAW